MMLVSNFTEWLYSNLSRNVRVSNFAFKLTVNKFSFVIYILFQIPEKNLIG
jgi:hypothetical protein